jgi:hypothetical protein
MSRLPTNALVCYCVSTLLAHFPKFDRQQQYQQQAQVIPPFVDLYQVCFFEEGPRFPPSTHLQKLVGLETDIENSLPKFQELLTTLG